MPFINKIEMKNKYILGVGLFLVINFSSSFAQQYQREVKPNIIYILADDLGYGDIKAFNKDSKIKTPNIDKLAAEGMKFTDAHTSSSVCTPTRYGILTGRYNWRTTLKSGVLGGQSKALIPKTRTTLASMLKSSGYNTAYIGKWHLGWDWAMDNTKQIDFSQPIKNGPKDLGFDYSYGHSGSLDMPPYVYVENGLPTSIPTKITESKGKAFWRKGLTADDFIHEEVTPNFFNKAIKYVAEQAKQDKPFFLYLPVPSPHTPILPTKEFAGISGLDNPYADFVMELDAYVGKLLKQVKDAGIEDNTLIIFTSDNGCSPTADFPQLISKGHNPSAIYRGTKSDIWEGGHRVPFIAKWPNKIKKGTSTSEVICTTDFFATAAAISNYKMADNEGEDSYNMMPLFENKKLNTPFREAIVHHSIKGNFSIRKGDWKLEICPGSGGWSKPVDSVAIKTLPAIQLYNLKVDIAEEHNLQASNPEKVIELKSLLKKYILNGRSTPGKNQNNDLIKGEWKQIDDIVN